MTLYRIMVRHSRGVVVYHQRSGWGPVRLMRHVEQLWPDWQEIEVEHA